MYKEGGAGGGPVELLKIGDEAIISKLEDYGKIERLVYNTYETLEEWPEHGAEFYQNYLERILYFIETEPGIAARVGM